MAALRGMPIATAPSAIASITRKTIAGPLPHSAVATSNSFSSRNCASPIGEKSESRICRVRR